MNLRPSTCILKLSHLLVKMGEVFSPILRCYGKSLESCCQSYIVKRAVVAIQGDGNRVNWLFLLACNEFAVNWPQFWVHKDFLPHWTAASWFSAAYASSQPHIPRLLRMDTMPHYLGNAVTTVPKWYHNTVPLQYVASLFLTLKEAVLLNSVNLLLLFLGCLIIHRTHTFKKKY